MVSATFSLLIGVAAPFKDTSDDYFAKACSYALTMLFFFVTVLKLGMLTEQVDSVLTDELRYRFSFDAAFVSAGMIFSIVGTLPLAAVMATHRLLQAARVQEPARCSESCAGATEMSGWSRAKEKCASSLSRDPGGALGTSAEALHLKRALNLRLSRVHEEPAHSAVDKACPTQPRYLPEYLPMGLGGALGRGVEADLNCARRSIGRTHEEPPIAPVDESEAAVLEC